MHCIHTVTLLFPSTSKNVVQPSALTNRQFWLGWLENFRMLLRSYVLNNYVTTFSIIPCILPFSPTPMTQHPLVNHPKILVMGKFGMNLHFYQNGFHVVFHLLAPYSSPMYSHILTYYLHKTSTLPLLPTYPIRLPFFFSQASSMTSFVVILSFSFVELQHCYCHYINYFQASLGRKPLCILAIVSCNKFFGHLFY